MSYYHKQCFNKGKEAEARFFKLVKGKEGTPQEDVKDHIDGRMKDGRTVDVKGFKRSHANGYILVEFKNVSGNNGWASKGSKADLIAFEFEKGFVVVDKEELRKFSQGKLLSSEVIRRNKIPASAGLYKLCGRANRKDVFTYITKKDLTHLEYDFYPT